MTENDEILAIPLWINGHAYLTMAPAFFDVRDRRTGQIRRRTPLCGTDQALTAVASAQAALPAWAALTIAARATLLAALAAALADVFAVSKAAGCDPADGWPILCHLAANGRAQRIGPADPLAARFAKV